MNRIALCVCTMILLAAVAGCGASVSEIKGTPADGPKGGPTPAQMDEMKNKMMEMQKQQAQQKGETQAPPGSNQQ